LVLFFKKELLASLTPSPIDAHWSSLQRRRSKSPHMPQLSFHTPVGALTLSEEDGAIVALDWGFGRYQTPSPLLREGRDQLQSYFDGKLTRFTLTLAPAGTPYQRRVWQTLIAIPYGATCSYMEIAARIGGSARSVGQANGANPIPIVIPCHRVVGRTGLGGYSGGEGLQTKRWLLALEQNQKEWVQHGDQIAH
jgi:methylated-DNA-[protein]-cysteine S-methyltransferase